MSLLNHCAASKFGMSEWRSLILILAQFVSAPHLPGGDGGDGGDDVAAVLYDFALRVEVGGHEAAGPRAVDCLAGCQAGCLHVAAHGHTVLHELAK